MDDLSAYLEQIATINGIINKFNSIRDELVPLPKRDRINLAKMIRAAAENILEAEESLFNLDESDGSSQKEAEGNVRHRMLKYLAARAANGGPATVGEIANSIGATAGSVTTILYKRHYDQFARAENMPGKTRWKLTKKGEEEHLAIIESEKPLPVDDDLDEDDFQDDAAKYRPK